MSRHFLNSADIVILIHDIPRRAGVFGRFTLKVIEDARTA
jgi:hypothetical protein